MPVETIAPETEILDVLRDLAATGWGLESELRAGHPSRFAALLGTDGLQALLRDVRIPVGMYRLLLDGQPQAHHLTSCPVRVEDQEVGRVLDPRRARDQLRAGASLLLAGLNEYWPPVRRLCREVERSTGLATSAFAVVSPPGAESFPPHFDKSDQLVLQCVGSKDWTVWRPLAGELGAAVDPDRLPPPAQRTTLAPGSLLYLPRRAPHTAQATDSLSIHVTLILASPSVSEIAERAARRALRALPESARTLPPFWKDDPTAHAPLVGDVAARVWDAVHRRVADELLTAARA